MAKVGDSYGGSMDVLTTVRQCRAKWILCRVLDERIFFALQCAIISAGYVCKL